MSGNLEGGQSPLYSSVGTIGFLYICQFCLHQQNITWQHSAGQTFYCGILKFQYFRFKLSILPNFIVNKVLFLILVGGRVGGWTAVSFVSDEPRKSETRERERERDLFILFLVGNGIQQKAKDQSDFTKLI